MAKMICPECKKDLLAQRKGNYETAYVDRDGERQPLIVPGINWLECQYCGETILSDAQCRRSKLPVGKLCAF